MRKHLVFALALVGVLALTGCKQDPLADYPPEVRNAKPVEEKPDVDPIVRDSLFIDTNEFYSVKEGETLSFEIKGRVLIPNVEFQIEILNLADFKGATFDPASGTFTWNVPLETVKNGPLNEIFQLKILLVTENALVREKTVPIHVLRELSNPVIESVSLMGSVREGERRQFEVTVRSIAETTQPSLSVIMNRSGVENGSGYVSLRSDTTNPIRSTADPTLYTFYLELNLFDVNVTKTSSNLYFGLQAASSFGIVSPVKNVQVKVLNQWVEPRISWDGEIRFTAERENFFSFTVFDPRDEGRVEATINNCAQLGASCDCRTTVRSQATCTIQWKPSAADVRVYSINVTARNISTASGDSTTTTRDWSRSIRVVAAPTPSPTPSPAPTQGGR